MASSRSREAEAAEHTVSSRVVKGSSRTYKSKLNTMKLFFASKPDFACYLSQTNDLIVPFSFDAVKGLFGWLSLNTDIPLNKKRHRGSAHTDPDQPMPDLIEEVGDDDDDNDDAVELENAAVTGESEAVEQSQTSVDATTGVLDMFATNEVTVAHSTMQGYKSALKWYYEEKKVTMEAEVDRWLDTFVHGYKRIVADKKERGVMSITEGKSPFDFKSYKLLATKMLKTEPQSKKFNWAEGIFSWAFFIFCWNLMCRSASVGKIMFQHCDWKDDHLVITFAKHKGDQDGEGLGNVKAVYANAVNPSICPLLALAVLIFTSHRGADAKEQQIFGRNSEDRFTKILQKILSFFGEQLSTDKKDIGTHSTRKGVVSYVLSLCGIVAVQVYLRAGWSLGNVQDRYIVAGAGGDEVVGRAACGLSITTKAFSVLPPHFPPEIELMLNSIGWSNILTRYDNYPECFQRVVPYLFASLIFHIDFLRCTLPSRHPLWNQAIFTRNFIFEGRSIDLVKELCGKILTGYGNCMVTDMRATGIPSELMIAGEVHELRMEIAALKQAFPEKLEEISTTLSGRIEGIPGQLKTMLLDHFRFEGERHLTADDVEQICASHNQRLLTEIRQLLNGRVGNGENPSTGAQLDARMSGASNAVYKTFHWGGKLGRFVPETFQFPTGDVKTMWNLWYYGHVSEGIQPYKRLKRKGYEDDLKTKQERSYLYRASLVMGELEATIRMNGLLPEEEQDIGSLETTLSDSIFDSAFPIFWSSLYTTTKCHRPQQVQYATLGNRILKKRKAARTLADGEGHQDSSSES